MSLPPKPEYDDRDGHDEFGMVMPFTCVASKDGPYDDVPFVAGFQVGRLDMALSDRRIAACTELAYPPLEQQLDLVAMRHGYRMDVVHRTEEGDWIHVAFTRIDEREKPSD